MKLEEILPIVKSGGMASYVPYHRKNEGVRFYIFIYNEEFKYIQMRYYVKWVWNIGNEDIKNETFKIEDKKEILKKWEKLHNGEKYVDQREL